MPGRTKVKRRDQVLAMAQRDSDRPRCAYCGHPVTRKHLSPWPFDPDAPRRFTMDHIIPKSHGGFLIEKNLLPACMPCNSQRGDMPLVDFILLLGCRAVMTVKQAHSHMVAARAANDAHAARQRW